MIVIRKLVAFYLNFFYIFIACFFLNAAHAKEYTTGRLTHYSQPHAAVEFMLTGQKDTAAQTVEGVLVVELGAGWKTYWHSPGEGGIAPTIDWSQSSNLNKVDWHWPVPTRYDLLGIETVGYKDSIGFPVTLHLDDINKPVQLNGALTLSSCLTICVLTDYNINMSFIPDDVSPSLPAMHLYNKGFSQTPKANTALSLEKAVWDPEAETVSLAIHNGGEWVNPDIFIDLRVDDFNETVFTLSSFSVDGPTLFATFAASNWMEKPQLLNKTLTLVISDEAFAVMVQAPLQLGSQGQLAHGWLMLLFALLGGLILNVMPCVLPVLGMKLSTVLSAQGRSESDIRRQFLASASGVIVSFWLLAGFLTVLKLSGQSLGWGIQFQNPLFILFMTAVTGLFAANMFGLFEIQLSSNTNTWLATQGGDSLKGHFVQGMFATLLATPCSAPFLGTAVAFALGAEIPMLFMIFTALGLGMAFPWLLIAVLPKLATWLPRPGPWMQLVKRVFALMMFATCLWLISLLTAHFNEPLVYGLATVITALLLLSLWFKHERKSALLVMMLAVLSSLLLLDVNKTTTFSESGLTWQPLDVNTIQEAVAQGKTVFVDITASWCVICKANKLRVMSQEPVISRLQAPDIVRMQGDWSNPSEKISDYLQSFSRYGVPFNIVYGPAVPEGIILPEVLTKDAVTDALKKVHAVEGG